MGAAVGAAVGAVSVVTANAGSVEAKRFKHVAEHASMLHVLVVLVLEEVVLLAEVVFAELALAELELTSVDDSAETVLFAASEPVLFSLSRLLVPFAAAATVELSFDAEAMVPFAKPEAVVPFVASAADVVVSELTVAAALLEAAVVADAAEAPAVDEPLVSSNIGHVSRQAASALASSVQLRYASCEQFTSGHGTRVADALAMPSWTVKSQSEVKIPRSVPRP